MISCPGNGPPNTRNETQVPTTGIDSMIASAIRRPGAGQQVVGQRVAGEALDDAEHDQAEADQPVELARLAERAGEEHPEHVDRHRGDEQQRRPVVDLPDDQAAADVEGDVAASTRTPATS